MRNKRVVMEEKEIYQIVYFDNDTSWKIIDNKTKQEVGGIDDMINLLNQQEKRIKELEEENQQLKQQLNDLPKKIVEEIEEEIVKYDLLNNSPNEAGYCMFDSILYTILKKYGGEDE